MSISSSHTAATPLLRRVLARFAVAFGLAAAALPVAAQDPLPRNSFSFDITTSDPNPGDGLCETPAANDAECAHVLNSVTVGGVIYSELTPPSSFSADGFPAGSNVQSRIYNEIGDFRVGDAGYNANMLANVFSDTDLNRYQQVDSNANLGSFTLGYAVPLPTTADNFVLITERLGNNTQFVEAFDELGVSLGVVEVTRGAPDYSNSGVVVGFNQTARIALIPLDRYADATDPSRMVASIRITNTTGNDGGDFKTFMIGAGVPPTARNDEDLNNIQGEAVAVDILANDTPVGTFDPSTVVITGAPGSGQFLDVPGQGEWVVNPANGQITFTPEPTFAGDPDPISYRVSDDTPATTNEATVTITYLLDPELTLVKTITNVANTNSNLILGDEGDTITYSFTVTNTGNVSLDNISITDPMLGLVNEPTTPTALAPLSVAPGQSAVLSGQDYVITGPDVTAGRVDNDATATGRPVATSGTSPQAGSPLVDAAGNPIGNVTDRSDTGSEPAINGGTPVTISDPAGTDSDGTTGNDGDEETVLLLPPAPTASISLTKGITLVADTNSSGVFGDAGDTVSYALTVTNTGATALADIQITDALLGLTNVALGTDLLPGESAALASVPSYVITGPDVLAGQVDNTATATGQPVDVDGAGQPDPASPLALGRVNDTSDTITEQSEATEPATGGQTPPSVTGDPALDDTDGTGGLDDDPTVLLLPSLPEITLVKGIDLVTDANASTLFGDAGDIVTYSLTVTNTGNTALAGITITDAMLGLAGVPLGADLLPGESASLPIVPPYVITALDELNTRVENTATTTATAVDVDGASGRPDPLSPLAGVGPVNDTSDTSTQPSAATVVEAGGQRPPLVVGDPALDDTDGTGGPGDDPTVLLLPSAGTTAAPAPGITLTKTTPDEVVQRGQTVPYTIQLINSTGAAFGPVDITDTLPDGFVFIPGSAQLNGAPVVPSAVTANTVTFSGIASPAGSTQIVTLDLRALSSTGPGTYVNSALALDPILGLTAGPATATVRILPEAVFDCTAIVGRVFDDLDGDGYQDSFAPGDNPPEISDQTYDAGKGDILPVAEDNEVGLPGVRLHTLDGLVITTDANGLFSVPCAAMPARAGSNFLLSLDERSLPLGFEMTTENPRVLRVTPGMALEMNFGAQLANILRVDLSAHAFGHDGALSHGLRQGIGSLVAHLQDNPSALGLIYHVPANANAATVAAGRAAMGRVEDEIRRQWSEVSRTRLSISQTIAREGQ